MVDAGALAALQASYAARGFVMAERDGGWCFAVAPELAHLLACKRPVTRKQPRAALATLAISAWYEPAIRAEIAAIRGVAVSAATLDLLPGLGWINAAIGATRRGNRSTMQRRRGFQCSSA